ncbi:acyl-CoA dehydrogenase family protein [Archaeoglobus profundus]|uniref:Acyl-CoA dehydrogenase domain protein n=1 Tax=Archaeoglobus profundus (strain DSM 5631 / JCM 9629 / NBRC 100127 / Av18) TaxID=572546 RepID=D2RI64_ARCPA|nr:acyl-CoA dehydrogenase [Archaeoglobus profundus]ADB57989.1 acyl-CoA dehydrogenase domain protein [Archaeoglobus profundus DSM 5631]
MDELLKLAKVRFVGMDKTNEYDRELLEYAKKLSLIKPMFLAELCNVVETIARFNPSLALSISAHHLALYCLKDCNDFCAFALTEKSGSNVKAIETKAEEADKGYIIRGSKNFVTNGEFAEVFVITARHEGKVNVFAVDKGGIKAERVDLGCFRGSGIAKIYIDGIGRELGDLKLAMSALNVGRVVFSSLALGIAKRCFELALNRAKRLGLINNQGLRWRFVDLKSDIEVVSSYINSVVSSFSEKDGVRPAICKLKACKIAKACADFAVEVFGAKGLIKHSITEILYRYAKALDIGEGTNEIMKEIISRSF